LLIAAGTSNTLPCPNTLGREDGLGMNNNVKAVG